MAEISLRPATFADLDFMRQVSARVFSIYGNYDQILLNWLLEPEVITVVAEQEARATGFAMLAIQAELELGAAHLLAIAVNPEEQRRGIGHALLRHMEAAARQQGLRRIMLHTAAGNVSARSFFRKAGFKIWGFKGDYYPRGQPAVLMVKRLE